MASIDDEENMGRTTIQVSDELADELHDRKNRGDSYEDVIWRLIEASDRSAAAEETNG
jgi:predicted CopG family antitoxin